MKSLFLDTSEKLVLGILDDHFEWIDYLDTSEKKGSGVIHGLLFELLKKNNLTISEIKNIFIMAGPGSYTGMRLGEGLAQVLEMFNINIFSTYHFDIPRMLNVSEGIWASKAFKEEVFVYSWKDDSDKYELKNEQEFQANYKDTSKNNYFTYGENDYFEDYGYTSELIKSNSNVLFSNLYNNKTRKELYYYRPLELEFKQTAL